MRDGHRLTSPPRSVPLNDYLYMGTYSLSLADRYKKKLRNGLRENERQAFARVKEKAVRR